MGDGALADTRIPRSVLEGAFALDPTPPFGASLRFPLQEVEKGHMTGGLPMIAGLREKLFDLFRGLVEGAGTPDPKAEGQGPYEAEYLQQEHVGTSVIPSSRNDNAGA